MKKTKFLMPILGIGTIATAITPILVSCNKDNSKTYTFNFESFDPSIEQKSGSIAENQITKVYFTDVNSNKKILAEDWVNEYKTTIGSVYKKVSLTIKNIKSITNETAKLSMKCSLTGDAVPTITMKFTNIPFKVTNTQFGHNENSWKIATTITTGNWFVNGENKDWSFYLDNQDPDDHLDFNYASLHKQPGAPTIASEILQQINNNVTILSSRYLVNVTPASQNK